MVDDKNGGDAPAGGESLLDNLLQQTRLEAEQEKQKLEKQLHDRAEAVRQKQEEADRVKRSQLKQRLEEETQRRQEALRRKKISTGEATEEQKEIDVEQRAAVAQALTTTSTVAKLERPPSILPFVIPLGAIAAGLAVVAGLLYMQLGALPTGMKPFGNALVAAVNAAEVKGAVKRLELQVEGVKAQANSGSAALMSLQRELSETKAVIAAKDLEIAALTEQLDAKAKARPKANGKEKKKSKDGITINNNIFKGGGAR